MGVRKTNNARTLAFITLAMLHGWSIAELWSNAWVLLFARFAFPVALLWIHRASFARTRIWPNIALGLRRWAANVFPHVSSDPRCFKVTTVTRISMVCIEVSTITILILQWMLSNELRQLSITATRGLCHRTAGSLAPPKIKSRPTSLTFT